jgi:hypothetical protein
MYVPFSVAAHYHVVIKALTQNILKESINTVDPSLGYLIYLTFLQYNTLVTFEELKH